mmetsp:Transcript_117789/g.367000  ORF Transcript_117789/g.367000 Transcript_117789/m.367000 type:complete len:331 (-) Transcript_117789:152-1144(-)
MESPMVTSSCRCSPNFHSCAQACDGLWGAATRASSHASLQTGAPEPLPTDVLGGLSQQLPTAGVAAAAAALQRRYMQEGCAIVAVWPCGVQIRPVGGVGAVACMVAKVPLTFFPATWLCSGGKMSGTPFSSSRQVAMPMMNESMKRTVVTTTAMGHLPIQSISFRRHREVVSVLQRPPRAPKHRHRRLDSGRAGVTASASQSPLEMSTTRRFTLCPFLSRSKITNIGGRKSRTKRKVPMTHRPMNMPNSRSGCSTLARFAKKLTDVVSDVARHALPACAMRKAIRASGSSRCALWPQKSWKTKTTSLPTPVMRNSARKDTTVVFAAGVST